MARKSIRVLNDPAMVKVLKQSLPEALYRRYWSLIRHWCKSKGPEWTATRMKALWNIALLLRSGQSVQIREVCLKSRIACDGRIPKGIEGVLVQVWALVQSPSKLRAMAVSFRAYTAIVLHKDSHAQVEKARMSITSPGVEIDVRQANPREFRLIQERKLPCVTLPPTGRVRPRKPLHLDKVAALSGTSSYPALVHIPSKDKKQMPYLSMCASMLTKGMVPPVLVEYFGDFSLRRDAEAYQRETEVIPTYGRINMIQEGGAKGRTVCSPNAWVQYYCYPFHKYLMGIVSDLEVGHLDDRGLVYGVSCALDQVRGVHVALNRLNNGSFCHAVDLSSATDRFPLKLQTVMCEELGIPEFGAALEELRGPYKGLDHSNWHYNAGQPMGLYGSFPLFHLTHYSLLNGLSHNLGLQGKENFCVLGDDVLIFDENLLRAYLDTLEEYQVPISWHKSYKGNLVEFAGFLITKSRDSWTAFRPYKFAPKGEMSSVVNVLHALGMKTAKWSNYWAKAFDLYSRSRGLRSLDLSPLIPSDSDIRKDEGLPGLAWLGSCFTRLSYSPNLSDLPGSLWDSWEADRYRLCQTQIQEGDPYYFGEIQSTDKVFDSVSFNPELYIQEDRLRKSVYQSFWKDPLVVSLKRAEIG